MQLIEPREVPLGGLRALLVRRTLPHRDRAFIGAWCFVDHYGPTTIGADGAIGATRCQVACSIVSSPASGRNCFG